MFILSIHSIIAGFALGIEDRSLQAVIILIAVLAHKGTASFALGISLLRGKVEKKKFISTISFFSFMTPLGIILGYLFSILLSGTAEQRFEAIFDSLAAGTFLYIAILDILNEEFSERSRLFAKYAFLLAGFGIMALVAIWT
jgi:zinc transporter 1/2/3